MKDEILILLIDDNENDRELFCRALTKCPGDFKCITSPNCMEALDMLHAHKMEVPQYIFLDLKMSLMGGLHCLSLVKKEPRLKAIPIIVLSGSAESGDAEEARRLGATHFMTKPDTTEILAGKLDVLLNKGERKYQS